MLGKGGFAEVYLGEHIYLNTQAAIKVLSTHLTDNELEQQEKRHGQDDGAFHHCGGVTRLRLAVARGKQLHDKRQDQKKRDAIFQEFVKDNVEKMYYIPYHFPVDWQPYYVAQPWVGGWGWHQPYIEQYPGGAGQILSQYWYDASKKS